MDPREAVNPAELRRQLAQRMLRGEHPPALAALEAIAPRDPACIVPLTLEQRQLWLHAEMAPDMPLYNETVTIHRLGPYDHIVFERAFNEIVRRHETLRTGFSEEHGEPVARVVEAEPIALPLIDLCHLPEAERNTEAMRLAAEGARLPIALDRAPLFRARVVRMAEQEHRLYLTMHHIIFDGVSIYNTMVPELAALVDAYGLGQPSPLAEPALHYGDYAAWQSGQADDATAETQLTHWRKALEGPLPRLEIAGDRNRAANPAFSGGMEGFALPDRLITELKALARAEGVTLYMVMLAAYKAMLFRYTGDTDIIVGGVTDTRRRPELQPMMGYFLNTMALRSHPEGSRPFREYLAEIKATVLLALGASDIPLSRIIQALGIKRGKAAHPLFNTLFSVQPPIESIPAGWDLTQTDVLGGAAKYDIYVEVDERPDGTIGRFMYSTELFDPATICRMIGHWTRLLEGVVANPSTPLSQLPMLGDDERQMLVSDWNQTGRKLPHLTVVDWYAECAAEMPNDVAIEQDGERWTYGELDRQANAIAAGLVQEGVTPGALVGLSLARTPWMVAAMLGVAKAGAAYLPLDPAFPPKRLAMIVEDAQPALVLVEPDTADILKHSGADLLMLEPDWPAADAPAARPDGDDLAYVLYTSGSTGRPKGVEISHAALANLLLAMQEQPGFRRGESLLAITTLSFDIAELELWLPLVTGGRVILAQRETAIDMAGLAALIASARPDVLQATPATWRGLLEAGWEGAPWMRALCGGEALPRALADELLPRVAELWNMYGPTETTIWSTLSRIEPGSVGIPIGKPIANTVVRVLDSEGNDRPMGAIGELLIGGMGLARGYRGRPDLTAEKFIEVNGERHYKTGDLARWRSDGVLQCLGRTDHEEKIRGFRVAIEEIEGALAKLPGIAGAAVRAWPDASGERALAAYVVGQGDAVDWRAGLAATLPDYMIPSRFVHIDELPLTPNGKVDRNALPELGAGTAAEAAPPANDEERRLAAIWATVLQVATVSRDDDFFDLGGHSLLVARLLRQIETEFGVRLTIAMLLRTPRLADMARLTIDRKPASSPNPSVLGSCPSVDRHNALATMLMERNPALRAVVADHPFMEFDATLDRVETNLGYHLPESARKFVSTLPPEASEDYVRAYILGLIGSFDERFAGSRLPQDFASQFAACFARMMDEMEWGTFVADLTQDVAEKDLMLARLALIPAGPNVIFPRGGMSRRDMLRWGPGAWRQVLRCGGHRPFLEPHLHDPLVSTLLNSEMMEESYRLSAQLLRHDPECRGLFAATWLVDPQLETVSPQLAYLREIPLAAGGKIFRIGFDLESLRLATTTCPHRLAEYEAGRYRPCRYGLILPRSELLKRYG